MKKNGQVLADFDGAPLMLPPTPFFYTLDQIMTMLSLGASELPEYLYLEGRTVLQSNATKNDLIHTINIAAPDKPPVWRVEEAELTRWLRHKGMVTAKARLVVRGAKKS